MINENLADAPYAEFNTKFDVLYDDRQERAGVKFNDADLGGFTLRVLLVSDASEGIVEVKERLTGDSEGSPH